jgi:flagellar basal body-associated protein FliL
MNKLAKISLIMAILITSLAASASMYLLLEDVKSHEEFIKNNNCLKAYEKLDGGFLVTGYKCDNEITYEIPTRLIALAEGKNNEQLD